MAAGVAPGIIFGAAGVLAVGLGGIAYGGHRLAQHGQTADRPVLQVAGYTGAGAALGTLAAGLRPSWVAGLAASGAVLGALYGASTIRHGS